MRLENLVQKSWTEGECKVKVKLDKKYSAAQIVTAFKAAKPQDDNWKIEEVIGQSVQTSSGLVKRIGARIYSVYEEKMFGFFGPKIRSRGGLTFKLNPLLEDRMYDSISVVPWFLYGSIADVVETHYCNDPADSRFEPARETWDSLMKAFYEALKEDATKE